MKKFLTLCLLLCLLLCLTFSVDAQVPRAPSNNIFSTFIRAPIIYGGTGVGSDLFLRSTSGTGDGTDHVYIQNGTDGSVTLADFGGSCSLLYSSAFVNPILSVCGDPGTPATYPTWFRFANTGSNVSLGLSVPGTGSLVLRPANATNGGFNFNGTLAGNGAVDLQIAPAAGFSATTTIASGATSFAANTNNTASGTSSTAFGSGSTASNTASFVFGSTNTASGAGAIAGGTGSTASAQYSLAIGNTTVASANQSAAIGNNTTSNGANGFAHGINSNDLGQIHTRSFGTTQRATSGDSQIRESFLVATVTNTSATRLTTNRAAVASTNTLQIGASTATSLFRSADVDCKVNAQNIGARNVQTYRVRGLLTRAGNASTVQWSTGGYEGTSGITTYTAVGSVGTLTLAASADTTNGGLNLTFTDSTGASGGWNVVAFCQLVEAQ